ncbi:PTPA-domain-containing protein [Phanerochaete sordida]|uniref:Serine/threonine-protein phosphatase 2A activator n=1 Tax=Phanerochaete sordida TaxID=48140 RepID=A0A9P3FZU0_9APHY|nr:PTPA-domain-containing protein [Phanerochaete sordida]
MPSEENKLLPLRQVPAAELAKLAPPRQLIKTEDDVHAWKHTRGYQDYGLFLRRLSESVVGHVLPWSSPTSHPAVEATLRLLSALDRWIDEIPPLPTPQRFGNLAFRTWGKRLEDQCDALLASLLPHEFHPAIPHVSPYLLTSFGSFTRMDYGTGHETSFALFLLCLALIRFYDPEPAVERELVLTVFVRYLRLCWRLQDVYKLEPAGSHGVWGLDDYSFLGYIFGSAQLRDQTEIPVSAVLRPPLPPTNLYFLSISRIHEVKYGPFHEHSSQLYSIATGVQYWHKVHSGLFKMYEAEVLSKRVVVQHLPLGGLIEWDAPEAPPAGSSPAEAAERPATPPTPTQSPRALPGAATAAMAPPAPPPLDVRTVAPTVGGPFAQHHPAGLGVAAGPRTAAALRQGGPLVGGALVLGPTANTSLRPVSRGPSSSSANVPPHHPRPGLS